MSGVICRGVDGERSVPEDVTHDAGVRWFHVGDRIVIHLVRAAAKEMLVVKNKSTACEVDDVVTKIEPRLPEENEGKNAEGDAHTDADGVAVCKDQNANAKCSCDRCGNAPQNEK